MSQLEEVHKLVKEYCLKNNKKLINLTVQGASEQGDGYLGGIFGAQLTTEEETLNLIVKLSPKDPQMQEMICVNNIYRTEVNHYRNIAPAFEKIQIKYNLTPIKFTPHCYDLSDKPGEEFLILQNLKPLGYSMCQRQKVLPLDNVVLNLKNYGRFHGMSLAIKHLDQELFAKLSSFDHRMEESPFKETFFKKQCKQRCDLIMEGLLDQQLKEKVRMIQEKMDDILLEFVEQPDDYSVFTHGDCWCNNYLFKYSNSSKVEDVKLIDFQFATCGNAMKDITYFMYTSASEEVLNNFDHYFNIYYQSMKQLLEQFKLNLEEIYPLKTLQKHLVKYSRHGLILTSMNLFNMLKQPEDVVAKDIFQGDVEVYREKDEYLRRMLIILQHVDRIGGLDFQ